jgi:hypothetical protein
MYDFSSIDINFFEENGYILIKDFYDLGQDIHPILLDIYKLIGLVAERHGYKLSRKPYSPDNFDDGYNELITINRSYGGEIYDLVKQIPSFLRLISNEKADALFQSIRNTGISGIGTASYGIRIDNPNEDKFRSHWHQEFLFQPQSLDGIVFWTPLLPISEELGPVIILPRSQKDGLCKYSKGNAYAEKNGAYKIGIYDEEKVIENYEKIAPLTKPGDLLLMDFLTIHGSGVNRSNRSRWSVQNRFFNYSEPVGMKVGWKASVTTGIDAESVFPNNFVKVE